ncbi:hypothetical protein GW950_00880 [Candidatus Wolfebacteria bacterium]|nr:hypothetical protein [Candidatus Wolfebacteria bacterium]
MLSVHSKGGSVMIGFLIILLMIVAMVFFLKWLEETSDSAFTMPLCATICFFVALGLFYSKFRSTSENNKQEASKKELTANERYRLRQDTRSYKAIQEMRYFQDKRTELCFAAHSEGTQKMMATVPCEKVKDYLFVPPKEK